ncbi:MAG: hypothetical protein ACREXI_12455, partial [Caldimonas sp.]
MNTRLDEASASPSAGPPQAGLYPRGGSAAVRRRRGIVVFPAYATALDKIGWWALRGACVGVLGFLLLPILVIIPLSFSDSSFLVYPIPG